MLKIGLVGLGSIAQKAYLPYLRQLTDVEWHICTRNAEIKDQVVSLFAQVKSYATIKDLVAADLDGVMIHAATHIHVEIASQFLTAGIPVYMDKPLAESYADAKHLYDLAEEHETFLMTGFNRRFAPRVTELKTVSNKTKIFVEKNDVNRPGDLQFKLFDFFIHPLDTALYLLDDEPVSGQFHYHKDGDFLSQISIVLHSASTTVMVGMNLQSGSRKEVMEVQSPEGSYHLQDLTDLTVHQESDQFLKGFGSWARTLEKRGFEGIVDAFLAAIKTGDNPVSPTSSLLSHWICDQINCSETTSGTLDVTLP
ncbi:Gfo/Idh/MocA family protein [Streptococcus moroccensis]|uniref:Virulence factor n=1 Tax=Streptococcus moroccensis TaxID=1451356 RepID=A0ABT9YPY4_9STRE|nr:Gfo/Idh/MocA family oxidoreductase [Streptococcus moroccensis]MDQ0222058.1 virulence factor [Streptococcus moroccensis]